MANYQASVATIGDFNVTDLRLTDKEKSEVEGVLNYKGVQLASFMYNKEVGLRFTKHHIRLDAFQTLIVAEYDKISEFDKAGVLPEKSNQSALEKCETIVTHLVVWDMLRQRYNEVLSTKEVTGNYIVLFAYTDYEDFYLIETVEIIDDLIGVNDFSVEKVQAMDEQHKQKVAFETPTLAGVAVLPQDFEFKFSWEEYFQFLEN